MCPRPRDERRALLDYARQAIVAAVHRRPAPLPSHPASGEAPGPGVFVSLHHQGRLRGCIGQVEPAGPLSDTLARCAAAAALEDPRFPPVGPQEIPELEIELSLLSRPEPVMPEQIEPGRHGLLVRQGFRSGLLLPQVAARYAWSAQRFLEETCIKAGLERDAWRDPATRVYAFTAEVFSEADFRAAGEAAS